MMITSARPSPSKSLVAKNSSADSEMKGAGSPAPALRQSEPREARTNKSRRQDRDFMMRNKASTVLRRGRGKVNSTGSPLRDGQNDGILRRHVKNRPVAHDSNCAKFCSSFRWKNTSDCAARCCVPFLIALVCWRAVRNEFHSRIRRSALRSAGEWKGARPAAGGNFFQLRFALVVRFGRRNELAIQTRRHHGVDRWPRRERICRNAGAEPGAAPPRPSTRL